VLELLEAEPPQGFASVSASGGSAPQIPWCGFAPGPNWGTSIPDPLTFWPAVPLSKTFPHA